MKPNHLRMRLLLAVLIACCVAPGTVRAQAGESDLRIYGYLQASFYHQNNIDRRDENTFTVQQLDIMMQKDLKRRWSTFVDLLFTNNYSSFRNTGTLDLQQAWVRYRRNHAFAVKAGLLIPRYNALNEIKNKMPVLPYVIRPIAYETSFQEDVWLAELVPDQAFLQVYGYVDAGKYKLEYAAYTGNSANIRTTIRGTGQSGTDSTTTLLLGGRIGVRHSVFKAGVSATHDKVNYLPGLDDRVTPALRFDGVRRVRFGADLSVEMGNVLFESEFMEVVYDEDHPVIDVDKRFFYGTLSYRFEGGWSAYLSYWQLDNDLALRVPGEIATAHWRMYIPNVGASYYVNDRTRLKAHVARAKQGFEYYPAPDVRFNFFAVAVSVMF